MLKYKGNVIKGIQTKVGHKGKPQMQIQYGNTMTYYEGLFFELKKNYYIVKHTLSSKGEKLTKQNIRSIRPGYGLAVKHIDTVLGMRVTSDVKRGTRMSWDLVK